MLRHLILAAAMTVLPAGVACAQITDITSGLPPGAGIYSWGAFPSAGYGRPRSPEDAGRDTEIEMKYNETLKSKIPDKKPSNDPWKSIRPAAAQPARAAPAVPAYDRHRAM